jgi:hypothetical protein
MTRTLTAVLCGLAVGCGDPPPPAPPTDPDSLRRAEEADKAEGQREKAAQKAGAKAKKEYDD